MREPGYLNRSQDDWCSLCPTCAFPVSQDTDGGDSSQSVALVGDSSGSLTFAPVERVSEDGDSAPEYMSFEQKIVDARRQLAHGTNPLTKTVE